MNAYIMSREKAFQLHPQDVTKEVAQKVNDYSEEVVQELLELHSDEEWIHAFQEYYKKPYIYSLYDKKGDSMKEYALNQKEAFEKSPQKTIQDIKKHINEVYKIVE